MKKRFALAMLAAIALAGCQNKELGVLVAESLPFLGTTESLDADTKTTLEDGRVLWRRGDQVSIFAGRTLNERYQVTDESEGQASAAFNVVSAPGFVSSTDISNNVSFYPYASDNAIALNAAVYELRTKLPAVQQYAEDSFGPGAFPMSSVTSSTSDYNLKFKNVLGGVKLQLKGDAIIASITIIGNADEVLCGAAKVSVEAGGVPSIELTDASATTVTLDCGAGVQLSSTAATSFMIALPPMTMTNGFTVIVRDTDGRQMVLPTERTQTIVRSNLLRMPEVEYVGEYESNAVKPFTITSTGCTKIAIIKDGSPDPITLESRVGNCAWTSYAVGTEVSLSDGEYVQFRAGEAGNDNFSKGGSNSYRVSVGGSGTVSASGNIMSLLDGTMIRDSIGEYAFQCLFYGCKKLVDASSLVLPSTILADYCYYSMFSGCTSLKTVPELPATTLATSCYHVMFSGCTSLAAAPDLPAATLADYCYSSMFYNCTSLSEAPELPATTLAERCYNNMFCGCTALIGAPELPATNLAKSCYMYMFKNCTGLTAAPVLPALVLSDYCYYEMFQSCTGLTVVPELPATTLSNGCYREMFAGCTGLATASVLPATKLSTSCYNGMFSGCDGLITAPDLPATVLADMCYSQMFSGCTSLENVPDELPATTLAKSCYSRMFENCFRLKTATRLPATILKEGCYDGMFSYCTDLITAPELPATSLVANCYDGMFFGCTKLNYMKALFTTVPGSDYTKEWLYGVASTGTFVKSNGAVWDVRGTDGIPEGWNVETAEEPEEPEKEVYMVNKPVITLIDDDFSLAWVDNLHDICMDLGIRCDFALIPMKDGDSLVITDEQKAKVMAYYDEGFGFHLHPRHDDWNPETFIDLEHTRRSLTGTIDAFRAAGLPDSFCDCLVYPHGCDIKGVRAMCAEYVSYGVTVSGLYTKNLKHPYDLERLLISFASRGTKSEIKEKIRKGVEQNAWIILGTHIWQFEDEDTVDETTYSLANLREVLEYAASLADFKTFGEVIASLEEE